MLELEKMALKSSVFIVDDDPSVRKALKRFVISAGYSAETYASAQEFLTAVPVHVEGCLILDMRMPGLNGLDLQAMLDVLNYKLPIIFITAFDNPQERNQAIDAGASAFLRKPFSDQELLEALESACV